MNTKRKTGFNIIDAFVILIILALIAGTVYFVWRKTKEPSSQLKERKTYRNAKPSKSSQMRNLKNSKLKPSEHTPQAIGYISRQEPTF